jgi:hypothetical protein
VLRRAAASALLALPLAAGTAPAATLPGSAGATDAELAVAADGTPRVAFSAADGSFVLAARAADGSWAVRAVPGLPSPGALVVGLAAGPRGPVALAEDAHGRWAALVDEAGGRARARVVAAAPAGGVLGLAGLALDARGLPVVAYTVQIGGSRTWLRLVREDGSGRLGNAPVTRAGFPDSVSVPAAAPVVLASGAVRVLETYDGGAIEWARANRTGDWLGRFVYATASGTPAGVARAAAAPAGVWSAWTELFPGGGESELLLTLHGAGSHTSVLDRHALLVSLALGPGGPELGGDDYLDVGARTAFAGLVLDATGVSLRLGAELLGYAVDPAGGRQYLLREGDALTWYRSPAPPAARVSLTASGSAGSVSLAGRVDGATGGRVELWRERADGATRVAAVEPAADGSFAAADEAPAGPLAYRAVYRDAAGGPPLGTLVPAP